MSKHAGGTWKAVAIAGAALALALVGPASADRPPKHVVVAVKIMDIRTDGADGGLRSVAKVCEARRDVELRYKPFGEGERLTTIATTRSDTSGFWEFDQPLADGYYQAWVGPKLTRDYRCKRNFSDIEEFPPVD